MSASHPAPPPSRLAWLALFAPGMLVAATGVGAGDLLTASLAGSRHGLALLWAAWVGALLKWFLNEGIARWQMATGTTLVEGWVTRLGAWVRWAFVLYLVPWAFFTGGALVSACGVAGTAILPLSADLETSKIAWGIAHSILGAVIVWRGGFRTFQSMMALCTALMVAGVVLTVPLLAPGIGEVLRGLLVPRIPPGGTAYTLGVLGGVGGTVTLLSYGYWIRGQGRTGARGAALCRIDLAGAYGLTALFGMGMIVIGSGAALQGPTTASELANRLAGPLGAPGRWIFLLGFWGAVYSSLLGVWQSVPYMFADFVAVARRAPAPAGVSLSTTAPYRAFLTFLTLIPLVLLRATLERAQLLYAVFGALFMPLLAMALLVMNTRTAWIGRELRNGWVTNLALVATLALFAYIGGQEVVASLARLLR
ncbi:MAG TPA: Nramp family divalent metal transporter [Gemmatimonadales bacterium]